jgi:hypothetical protein
LISEPGTGFWGYRDPAPVPPSFAEYSAASACSAALFYCFRL